MIYKLNLPIPSKDLLELIDQKIIEFQNTITNRLEYIRRSKMSNDINSVFQLYNTHNTGIVKELVDAEYSDYFGLSLHPTLISFENMHQDRVACFPPHTDDYRNITLNYYLQQGGSAVETVFYDEVQTENLNQGLDKDHRDLFVANKFLANENCWYLLDAKRFHSVENIETERRIFSLSFNLTYDEFIVKYNNLLLVPPEGIEPPSPRS
jgi:hypothetical protein